MTGFTLDVFLVIAVASFIAAFGVVPMSTHFIRKRLTEITIPPERAAALSAFQGGVLAVGSAAGGLIFAGWAGFPLPVVRAIVTEAPMPLGVPGEIGIALPIGAVSAAVIVVLDWFVFWSHLPTGLKEGLPTAWWKRLLATLYGGVTEEVITRLFFLSMFAWALSFVWSNDLDQAATPAVWGGIALAALVFGLLHLPATILLAPLSRIVVVRTLVLNGVVGVAAGWIFVEYGLVAAMAAHWAADVVILMIAPVLQPMVLGKRDGIEVAG